MKPKNQRGLRTKRIHNDFLRSRLALAAIRLALFAGLFQVTFAPAAQLDQGDLVIVSFSERRLYRYQPDSATVSVLASAGQGPTDIALGEGPDAGRAWVADYMGSAILRLDLATGLTTTLATGHRFLGIALHNGLLYTTTAADTAVRVYDAGTGALVNTFADSPATGFLEGIRYDPFNDRIVVTDRPDSTNRPARIDAMTLSGTFSNLVSTAGASLYYVAIEANGNILVGSNIPVGSVLPVASDNSFVRRVDVHAGNTLSVVASGTPLYGPLSVAVDAAGNIYAANYYDASLIRMKPDGTALTNLGSIGIPGYGNLYSVVVATAAASFSVPPRVAILQQPQSQMVNSGTDASFYVVATGTPPLTYQWRFQGTNLNNGVRMSGTLSNTLTISSAQASDQGVYDVVVSNTNGSTTSDAASLKFSNQTAPPPNAAPSVVWARTGGGPTPGDVGLDSMSAAVADGKGGVYVAGAFSQYARFGNLEVTAPTGVQNFLLVKYDAEGKPVWTKQGVYEGGWDGRNSADYTTISGLAATPDGGVVVAGYCLAPSTIDGQFIGTDSNTNLLVVCPDCWPYPRPSWAGFVTRYDANGNRSWFHVFYSYDVDPRVATDPLGNIYVVSTLAGVVDIDGQMNPVALDLDLASGFVWDHHQYLLKFDSAGQFKSLTQIMVAQEPFEEVDMYDLKADAEGNCYLIGRFYAIGGQGYFTHTLNIGSLPFSISDPNDGGADINFVAKLDASGAGLWAKSPSTNSLVNGDTHRGGSIEIDGLGNAYISVPAQQCTDLSSPDRCAPDSKLVKLNPFGTELWERPGVTFDQLSTGGTHALVCDAAGNCVAVGWYQPRDFQDLTGQAVTGLYGPTYGMGLVAFDPAGGIRWAKYFSERGSLSAPVLVQDSPNSWFLAGTFIVNAQLEPFQLQTPWPGDDIEDFIARLVIPATNDLPIITLQPSDVTVFETRPLGLEVAAASLSGLSYQWRSNGIPLPGATSNTLAFANATPPLSGQYSVSLSNSNGRVDSAPATVTVLPLTTLAAALNATNLEWRLGGVRSWNLETNVTHDGVLSLRTDYLDPGSNPTEDCWIETTLPGPGVLSFWWKASVNVHNPFCGCDDGFQFLLDGVQQFEILGDVDWQPRSLPVGPGPHTARWYWSEPKLPGNLNLCWVDQVSFQPPANAAPTVSDTIRLADGKIQFTIHTSPGATLGIEASTDLKSWLAVGQLISTNGVATFTHAAAVNYQQHFYRAVLINP